MFFLTLICAVVADPCEFEGLKLYSLEQVKQCIDTIPFDSTEMTEMIRVLNVYMDYYVFNDITCNPPAPFGNLKVNLTKKLEAFKLNVSTYTSTFDLFSEITKLLLDVRDAHTQFTPCSNNLYWILPYTFGTEVGNNVIKIYSNGFTEEYLNITAEASGVATDLSNSRISGIDIGDGNGWKDAWEVIANWAAVNESTSKNANTNFNMALLQSFSQRSVWRYPVPPGASLRVLYETAIGTFQTAVIPFFSTSLKTINSIDDMCPKWPSSSKNNLLASEKEKTGTGTGTKTGMTKAKIVERFQRAQRKAERERYERERQMQELMYPRRSHTAQTLAQMLAQGQQQSHVKKNLAAAPSITPVLVSEEANAFLYNPGDGTAKTGYLQIPTFNSEDPYDYADKVGGAVKDLKETHHAENLIIDLRLNTGGVVDLGLGLAYLLDPSTFPFFGVVDLKKNDFTQILYSMEAYSFCDAKTGVKDENWYDGYVERTFTDVDGVTSVEKNYTKKIGMLFQDCYSGVKTGWPGYGEEPLYDAQHLLLLTDGICGSTCAVFVKRMKEGKRARIVQVGGRSKASNPLTDFDIGSFSGGGVLDSLAIDQIRTSMVEAGMPLPPGFPPPFPRAGTSLTFAFVETYSSTQPDTIFEFLEHHPDFVIPIYPPYEDDDTNFVSILVSKFLPLFNVCASWEVLPDTACPAPAGSNSIYGRPCGGDSNWNTAAACVFSRCADGYYLSFANDATNGKCVKGPPVCLGGQILSEGFVCACPAGLVMTDAGVCGCPAGQSVTDEGVCECPAGQIITDAGTCEADSGSSKVFTPFLVIVLLLSIMML